MPGTDKITRLRLDVEKAEAEAAKLTAEKDKVREKLRAANDKAAAAQKALSDAEAAQALVGRDDAEDVAAKLGLDLPE